MEPSFSAETNGHTSHGDPDVIKYENTILNQPSPGEDELSWDKMTFRVPEPGGTYFFSIDFVKDAWYHGGTEDDVLVVLEVTPPQEEPKRVLYAWSGEGSGKRGTGAVSTVLSLTPGTTVCTLADSDTGRPRHIAKAHFSGFRIH